MANIVHVCTGKTQPMVAGGRELLSAIRKAPVAGPASVGRMGLQGDEQADPSVHGGLAKAVYAYPAEHLPFWQTVRAQAGVAGWNDPVPAGLFGENLLLQGLLEAALWVGDRLRVRHAAGGPGCLLAVTEPRLPCLKFNAAMGFARAGSLMVQSGYCGSYLAVVEPGQLQAGDTIELLPGPREVGLRELFRSRARPG